MKILLKLTLIVSIVNFVCGQNLKLTVQTTNSYNGPQIMGINMGNVSYNSNWPVFLERLGVNSIRLFVTFAYDLRNLIGAVQWGKDLNGVNVVNQASFIQAVQTLRTPNGRNQAYPWANPVQWSQLKAATSLSAPINGSIDDIVQNLNNLQIKKLFVLNIACGETTNFTFSTMDRTSPAYWAERWELYKFSYATAIYARNYGVSIIEFMNEPDQLILAKTGACLNANTYLDYYLIRSQSIQEAYNDMNAADPVNKVQLQISATAFSQSQFGGDPTLYLGDISVNNASVYFSSNTKNSTWSNMQLYSYHIYHNDGPSMLSIYQGLTQSVNAANPTSSNIPVIITEHNSHAGTEWEGFNTTVDTDLEAALMASQIANLVSSPNFAGHYVYKFSSVEASGVRKTGLHWCDITNGRFLVGDNSLSAEAFRLLTPMKNSRIFSVSSNDDPKNLRTFLASTNGDGNFYLYAVNDNSNPTTLNIDLSALNINDKTQIIVETASNNYYGEVSSTISTVNKIANLPIDPYSTTRLTIQQGVQIVSSTNSVLTCTANAGSLSNANSCSTTGSNQFILSGTSNTASHESTSVALIKFSLAATYKRSQRVLLNIMVDSIVGSQSSRVAVLGVRNPSFSLTPTSASWNSLSSLLNPLSSGAAISSISQNFINWSSNANFSLVGHISVPYPTNSRSKMIDVTDYVNQMINSGASQLNFLLYRPFRHPGYQFSGGAIPADDLSSGSLVRINGAQSANPPQLLFYNSN